MFFIYKSKAAIFQCCSRCWMGLVTKKWPVTKYFSLTKNINDRFLTIFICLVNFHLPFPENIKTFRKSSFTKKHFPFFYIYALHVFFQQLRFFSRKIFNDQFTVEMI